MLTTVDWLHSFWFKGLSCSVSIPSWVQSTWEPPLKQVAEACEGERAKQSKTLSSTLAKLAASDTALSAVQAETKSERAAGACCRNALHFRLNYLIELVYVIFSIELLN